MCTGLASTALVACSDPGDGRPVTLPDTYATEFDDLTREIARNQSIARLYTDYQIANGEIVLSNGQMIQLIDIEAEPCGQTELSCDVSAAEVRDVGESAAVVELEWLTNRVRNQGSRGTCASFTVNGAVELLANREGVEIDLSEQYTYWAGHFVAQEWDIDGLVPSTMVSGLVNGEVALIPETAWPYNPRPLDCTAYEAANPGFTCAPTIAQGAGEDGRSPPPEAEGRDGIRITDYELLPASLGRLKVALWSGYPVMLSVDANLDFAAAGDYGGVVDFNLAQNDCTEVCGHAILAVGYADDPRVNGGGYVIIRNQWAAGWGDTGLGYLTYSFLENVFLSAIAIKEIDIPQELR